MQNSKKEHKNMYIIFTQFINEKFRRFNVKKYYG